ncbi:phage tail protein [Kaistia sp. 32K]|uniref:phage tail tube protein n=1 Tax=Kaistia sp. 32K TaxID=2795690 RepID=UPI001915E9A3|nr:phage tail tube protein [Kaistia sp. 32K]BCP53783.1 phage tail protein [Kaistia sp. 32K]
MAARRVAGIATITVDGVQYPLRGNFTVTPSKISREGIAGQDGVHGYKEMPSIPQISGDITMVPQLSLTKLRAITDATVVAELASGHVYVLRDAWTTGAQEINTADGQVSVVWQGLSCREITPS